VQNPPYFQGMGAEPGTISNIEGAKVLAMLGDMITTDHISPAGSFKDTTPGRQVPGRAAGAGARVQLLRLAPRQPRVMMRGTFANIRIKNEMLDGVEGGYTKGPDGQQTSIFDAAMAYQDAGHAAGGLRRRAIRRGSSRDWAAKGTNLLGVKAVIAESFERIHRSNLVGMGVIPFEFTGGDTRKSLGLKGDETVSIHGLDGRSEAAAAGGALHDHLCRRHGEGDHAEVPDRYGESRSNTSRTAACCTTCCATSRSAALTTEAG
jgi:aconitate hydratase